MEHMPSYDHISSFESVGDGRWNNEGTAEEDSNGEGNDVTIGKVVNAVARSTYGCGVFIEVDIAAAGATNSLNISDNVDAADPTFMISVTFDRDQN